VEETKQKQDVKIVDGVAVYFIAKGTSHKKAASGIRHLYTQDVKKVELHAIGVLPVSQAVKTIIEVKRLIFADNYRVGIDLGYKTKQIQQKEVSVTVFTLSKV